MSWCAARPANMTASSPARITPAMRSSRRQALAFTDRRDVVTQIRSPATAYTMGVTCGPLGVEAAT